MKSTQQRIVENPDLTLRLPSVSRQITQQFSQNLFRIQTRTRSRRHCGGPHPRRLTKALEPSPQCPTGADWSRRAPDGVPTSDWCERARVTRQTPDRSCFCQDQWKFQFCNCCIIVLLPGLLLRGRLLKHSSLTRTSPEGRRIIVL